MPRETLRQSIERVKRAKPNLDPATRFLYGDKSEFALRGGQIVAYAILDAGDNRAMFYELFVNKETHGESEHDWNNFGVSDWAEWLNKENKDGVKTISAIMKDSVLAYMTRKMGGVWRVRGLIGWHFQGE